MCNTRPRFRAKKILSEPPRWRLPWLPFELELRLAAHAMIGGMKIDPEKASLFSSVFGALAGGCFVAITQLAVKSDPQWLDRRAMVELAAALPMLIASSLIYRQGLPTKNLVIAKAVLIVASLGVGITVWGVSDMMRAMTVWAAGIFGIIGTLMILLMFLAEKNRE